MLMLLKLTNLENIHFGFFTFKGVDEWKVPQCVRTIESVTSPLALVQAAYASDLGKEGVPKNDLDDWRIAKLFTTTTTFQV